MHSKIKLTNINSAAGTFANKSKEFVDEYFASRKDIQCMRDHNICEVFEEWKT